MMRQVMFAAAAALALAACNQQGAGPALPPVQEGAQAPAQLTPVSVRQATVTPEVRAQLLAQIDTLLDGYQGSFAGGMTPVQGLSDEIATLQPGTDHRWQVNLTGGSLYTFLGACDGDCTNIDIELIDMRTGGVVASDMLSDDYPVVNFSPPADGAYLARLIMQTCTVAPCFAGMRAMSQAAAPAAENK